MNPDDKDHKEEQFASSVAGERRGAASEGAGRPAVEGGFYRSTESWREEVASRVNSYRKRRRRFDPETSLRLDFEAQRHANRMALAQELTPERVLDPSPEPELAPEPQPPLPAPAHDVRRTEGKLIVFPRVPEAAEPVLDQPRILEVPDPELAPAPHFDTEPDPLPPPMPAILLDDEPAPPEPADEEIDVPLQVASISQRLFAAIIDGGAVLAACAAFAYIVVNIAGQIGFSRMLLPVACLVFVTLWATYHYVLLVWNGSTPGIRAARLCLRTFEGERLSRSARRIRALSLLISCLPLGLGFAWAFLDEDTLCWHDRITRTCLVRQE